jgi:hypothetical protein
MSSTHDELIERIWDATTYIDVADRGDAAALADEIIDVIIKHLRADPSIPRRTCDDWTNQLADLRASIERRIAELCDGRVSLQDMIEVIVEEIENGEGEQS